MEWTIHRKTDGRYNGRYYTTLNGKVIVQRLLWTQPTASTGWVVLVNGKQHGAVRKTAFAARMYVTQPGVWAAIKAQVGQ